MLSCQPHVDSDESSVHIFERTNWIALSGGDTGRMLILDRQAGTEGHLKAPCKHEHHSNPALHISAETGGHSQDLELACCSTQYSTSSQPKQLTGIS